MSRRSTPRTDRKIELGRLSISRPLLIAEYSKVTTQLAPPNASDWDLIQAILDAEFPRLPQAEGGEPDGRPGRDFLCARTATDAADR